MVANKLSIDLQYVLREYGYSNLTVGRLTRTELGVDISTDLDPPGLALS